jgi:hypothetical protein
MNQTSTSLSPSITTLLTWVNTDPRAGSVVRSAVRGVSSVVPEDQREKPVEHWLNGPGKEHLQSLMLTARRWDETTVRTLFYRLALGLRKYREHHRVARRRLTLEEEVAELMITMEDWTHLRPELLDLIKRALRK